MKITSSSIKEDFVPFIVNICIESEDDALTLLNYLNPSQESIQEFNIGSMKPPKEWTDTLPLFSKIKEIINRQGISIYVS